MPLTWDEAVGEEIHGIFFSTPGVTLFAGSLKELGASKNKFMARPQGGGLEYLLTDLLTDERSLDGVAPILTRNHELYHYMQLTSTTFGLALWQAEVAMCDLLLEKVGDSSEHQIKANVENAQVVYDFVLALRERQALTMFQFLELANRAQAVIANRWGLPRRVWVARDSSLSSYLPEGLSDSLEVVEGAARIVELRQLESERTDIPDRLMTQWDSTRLFGPYRKVVIELRSAIGHYRVSNQLCDLALLGEIALSKRAGGIPIVVEEALPGWRLESLTAAVRQVLLPWQPAKVTDFIYDKLPQIAGLPSLSTTWRSYSGASRNLGDRVLQRRQVGALDDTQYHRWVLRRYARGFDYRRKGNAVSLLPDSPSFGLKIHKEGGFQPFLEFYSDAMLCSNRDMARNPELAIKCYYELVRTSIVHAVLGEAFDLRFLRQVEQNLEEYLLGGGGPSLRDHGLGITQLVRALITNDELLGSLKL